jgi:hypothetical protein
LASFFSFEGIKLLGEQVVQVAVLATLNLSAHALLKLWRMDFDPIVRASCSRVKLTVQEKHLPGNAKTALRNLSPSPSFWFSYQIVAPSISTFVDALNSTRVTGDRVGGVGAGFPQQLPSHPALGLDQP